MGTTVKRIHPVTQLPRMPGFTLIELLIVIAIIGMLVSLLMPALASSRKSGQTVVCASNLRQLAIAATAYVNDNDDWMNPLEDLYHANGVEIEATYRTLIYTYTGGTPRSMIALPKASRFMPMVSLPLTSLMAESLPILATT